MSITVTSLLGSVTTSATKNISQNSLVQVQHTAPLINHLAMIKNLNPGAASAISSLPNLSTNLTGLVGQFSTFLGAGGFLSQLGSLTSAFGQLQTIAGSFGSITSIAEATAAFNSLGSVLSSITDASGFLSSYTSSFGDISGALGNLTSLSGTFSSLTNISSLSGITSSLDNLAGISGIAGISSISSITSSLQSVQNLANSVSIQTGFFDPTQPLSDATTLLSNINDTLLGSSVTSDLTTQSNTLNATLQTIQPDLETVNTALAPYA